MSLRLNVRTVVQNDADVPSAPGFRDEHGLATLIALIALSLFSVIALYMSFNATTEVRISDNYEAEVQALFAAKAGLNHAREAMRGIPHDDMLKGPDGNYDGSPGYLTNARAVSFRNPLTWTNGRALNVLDPTGDVTGLPDDGLLNTGKAGTTDGTALVPLNGVPFTSANPYGEGTVTTARYFVRVSDNNSETSELASDMADNPFLDGDGIIIIRSMGVARTIRETASGGIERRNAVAVVEGRYKLRKTMELDAPFVVEGNNVSPSGPNLYNGNSFNIDGGTHNPGIATIDTAPSDAISPSQILKTPLAKNQENNITGLGASPSIQDITASLIPGTDKALLQDPGFLWDLVNNVIPPGADNYFEGNQHWSAPIAFDLGSVDTSKPMNDTSQNPKVTVVKGDLDVTGDITGGGVLVVTGKLRGQGHFLFNGLMLVIGAGEVDMGGWNLGLNGGMFVCNVTESGGSYTFGTPKVTIAGNSNININSDTLSLGTRLLPSIQLSWREITSQIDP